MKGLLLLTFLALPAAAAAQGYDPAGKLGLGIELGEQNGGAAKYWLTRDQALSTGLGIASNGNFAFHAEYDWASWKLLPKPPKGDFDVHASFGFRVRDDEFGLRPTAGIGYWLPAHPIETFFDAGPIFRLSPDQGVDFTAVIGVRFYFSPGGKS